MNGLDTENRRTLELEVERKFKISLGPFELSDVDDFMVWATDDRVSQFCGWNTFTSKEAALDYINYLIQTPWTRAIWVGRRPIFKDWPHLERVEGLVDVENKASQRVLEKAGFQKEGQKILLQGKGEN
ncbi:hypothetical protein MKW94_027496 [Papaver nudicaule]|uniref:N-acetyltransferase domain-containing protein n=1 Tax=Papaver nudicaule TaxID=74823 RepID=A0AA41RVW5_PAPNU|nr:hypothetical protein [Papaver nudicaule]